MSAQSENLAGAGAPEEAKGKGKQVEQPGFSKDVEDDDEDEEESGVDEVCTYNKRPSHLRSS